mmetsp:Transcript_1319/g.3100  ORF Transcript_1319/g.3100 Transcript_1319/m.3100 type:complete len:428 (-) Transcript_1319:14-1297(-)|eukprot:jgi/Tetstr1/434749/TSEL_023801.t1
MDAARGQSSSMDMPMNNARRMLGGQQTGGGSSLGSLGAVLGASPGASLLETGEYTFTDRELQDILVFLEHQQKPGGPGPGSPAVPAAFLGATASPLDVAAQLPMQFQPHNPIASAEMARQHAEAAHGIQMQAPINFVKQEPPGRNGPGGLLHSSLAAPPPVYSQSLSMRELYPQQPQPQPTQEQVHLPPAGSQAAPSKRAPSNGALSSPTEKPQISHSTVEKQRRDRINSLIDELRDIVPPQTPGNSGAIGDPNDVKRPKHVVLSDTIVLLKKLQSQPQGEHHRSGSRGESVENSGDSGMAKHLLGLNLRGEGHSSGDREQSAELPVPPKNQNANGVVVESGEDCMLVKVSCRDRRGLLSDLITCLKSLDLEISTAAVTTTPDGTVHDVFEIHPGPGLSAEEIQCHVHSTVYSMFNINEKRPRASGT